VVNKRYRLIAATTNTPKLVESAWGYWYFKIT
jgi:hypothetical protein